MAFADRLRLSSFGFIFHLWRLWLPLGYFSLFSFNSTVVEGLDFCLIYGCKIHELCLFGGEGKDGTHAAFWILTCMMSGIGWAGLNVARLDGLHSDT
ncbi:hypothetical protein B0T10DRAFT_31535 [Thelonectria olida]|uniref:Uncharacterized protein n=1 Tax=Thelonectria olida TaxID=1576542 RepID=A0A9P8WJ23_9HYPO|nr:hypothetical protein B0T10DRAFT_31535 [Thelonectria olida]